AQLRRGRFDGGGRRGSRVVAGVAAGHHLHIDDLVPTQAVEAIHQPIGLGRAHAGPVVVTGEAIHVLRVQRRTHAVGQVFAGARTTADRDVDVAGGAGAGGWR